MLIGCFLFFPLIGSFSLKNTRRRSGSSIIFRPFDWLIQSFPVDKTWLAVLISSLKISSSLNKSHWLSDQNIEKLTSAKQDSPNGTSTWLREVGLTVHFENVLDLVLLNSQKLRGQYRHPIASKDLFHRHFHGIDLYRCYPIVDRCRHLYSKSRKNIWYLEVWFSAKKIRFLKSGMEHSDWSMSTYIIFRTSRVLLIGWISCLKNQWWIFKTDCCWKL